METDITLAIVGIFGMILTSIIGYYVGKKKEVIGYNISINIEAWKERSRVYKNLMGLMRILPLYPNRIGEVKYQEILDCCLQLKDWYFDGAGLFLSEDSRDRYFDVQEMITSTILQENFDKSNPKLQLIVNEKDYEGLRKLMSNLRTELTKDLLSRERNHSLDNV